MKIGSLIEKINKLNLVERFSLDNKKIALIFIISLVIIYVDFNFILKPQMAKASKSKVGFTKMNNELKALDAGLKNMQAVKSAQKAAPKAKEKRIIFEPELTALLHDISKLANANNVRVLQIKPARDLRTTATVKFSPVLINLDIICGYHNFGKFVNSLENNQVFISVENFKIESQPKDILRQKISVTLKTYVRK